MKKLTSIGLLSILFIPCHAMELTRTRADTLTKRHALIPTGKFEGFEALLDQQAQRLLTIAKQEEQGGDKLDEPLIDEIRQVLNGIKNRSSVKNEVVEAALKIYDAEKLRISEPDDLKISEEFIARALYAPSDIGAFESVMPDATKGASPGQGPSEATQIKEFQDAIKMRKLHQSTDGTVNAALAVYRKQEVEKADRNAEILKSAAEGRTGKLQAFVNQGINLDDVFDHEGNSLLALAVINVKLKTIEYLLSIGAKKDTINAQGHSVLDLAEQQKNTTVLQLLKDAQVASVDNRKKEELFNAVKLGNLDALKDCLKIFSPLTIDSKGNSLLTLAAMKNQYEIVKYLVERHQVPINCFNHKQQTVLDLKLTDEIAAYLKNKGGFTANQCSKKNVIFQCVHDASQARLCTLLNEKELTENKDLTQRLLNSTDIHGNTPLAVAVKANSFDLVKLLAENYHVELNSLDQKGCTALDTALERSYIDISQLLQKQGALSQKNLAMKQKKLESVPAAQAQSSTIRPGNTSMHYRTASALQNHVNSNLKNEWFGYVKKGNSAGIASLIKQGLLEERDSDGRTALAIAAACLPEYKDSKIIAQLIAAGAHPNALDDDGKSILDIALSNENLLEARTAIFNTNAVSLSNHATIKKENDTVIELLKANKARTSQDILIVDMLFKYAQMGDSINLKQQLSNYPRFLHEENSLGNTLLHVAAENAHVNVVTLLITDMKINVNIFNKKNESALDKGRRFVPIASLLEKAHAVTFLEWTQRNDLKKYASLGDVESFKKLHTTLKERAPNFAKFFPERDDKNNNPLLYAVKFDRTSVIKYIIGEGLASAKQTYSYALSEKKQETIDWLLKHYAKEVSSDSLAQKVNDSPLTISQKNIANRLREAGGSLMKHFDPRQKTPNKTEHTIRELAASGTINEIQKRKTLMSLVPTDCEFIALIQQADKGENIDALKDERKNSLMALAVVSSNEELVKELLARKASPNVCNSDEDLPYQLAHYIAHLKIMELLKAAGGFNRSQYINLKETCRFAQEGKLDELKRKIKSRTSPDSRDENNNSLIALAVIGKQEPVVRYLVEECKAHPNTINKQFQTPLDLADPNSAIEDILLTRKALYFRQLNKIPQLIEYIQKGDIEAFKGYINTINPDDAGPGLTNLTDENNDSLVAHAVRKDDILMVRYLITDLKAYPNIMNKDGKTPRDIVEDGTNNPGILAILDTADGKTCVQLAKSKSPRPGARTQKSPRSNHSAGSDPGKIGISKEKGAFTASEMERNLQK